MKLTLSILVIIFAASLGAGFATGNITLTEADFLKLLWFACGLVVSAIVFFTCREGEVVKQDARGYRRHIQDRELQGLLGISAIPLAIFTIIYIIVRAINIAG